MQGGHPTALTTSPDLEVYRPLPGPYTHLNLPAIVRCTLSLLSPLPENTQIDIANEQLQDS